MKKIALRGVTASACPLVVIATIDMRGTASKCSSRLRCPDEIKSVAPDRVGSRDLELDQDATRDEDEWTSVDTKSAS
jgi:hypothetical protein